MKKILMAMVMLGLALPVFAGDGAETDNYFGAGALIRTRPYRDADSEVLPVPIVNFRYEKFFADARKLGYDVYRWGNLELAAILRPRLMGYDGDDSDFLSGMEGRDWSMDGGAQLRWEVPDSGNVALNLIFVSDLLGVHEGQEVGLTLEKKIKGEIFRLTPSIGVSYASEALIDYYYGVRPEEATAARAGYEPDGAMRYFVDVNFNLGLSQNWVFVTVFNCEFLSSEVQDSPIIEDDYVFSSVVGLIRKF